MTDRATLHVFLLFAQALKASSPFDAIRVLQLLQGIRSDVDLPMAGHMDAALKASIAAMSDRQAHNVAVARYTLERVMIEVERMLDMDAV
ncbi:hypothetical protein D3273_09370 [Lichenibacterium minor]|jgi:hypothetical protein|uniref:Uncharacterized protein n=1 Tax=Lichenibacterium minor TaxID=2316528 RepID=A0A4Q2U782_9HYPH|nr:hypothetical protein [Lichenibacterium minor]RYC32232.1 hypothetical protein D3273_09370 [Lichenibacterium minor]